MERTHDRCVLLRTLSLPSTTVLPLSCAQVHAGGGGPEVGSSARHGSANANPCEDNLPPATPLNFPQKILPAAPEWA